MGRGLLHVPLRALLRRSGVGSREQVQPPLPLPRRRSFWGGGAPRPWGGGGPRLWLPSWGGCGGGGVGGPPPRPLSGLCGRGGGSGGGPLVPWQCLLTAGGGGGMAVLAPGASHWLGGRALPPPPSTENRILAQALAGAPHPPAVVARRWPAGGGREG